MTVRIPSRRSFVVGPAFAVGEDTIDEADHLYVVHVGDPPFVARIAEPDESVERLIECGDGQALAELVWLTPKRANGRLLDSLLAAGADAVGAFKAGDDYDGDEDEDEDEAVTPDDARGLAAQVVKGAAKAGLDAVPILGFDAEADYRRVMGGDVDEVMPWSFYLAYVAALDELAPEAGVTVMRLPCDPVRYEAWLKEVDRTNTPEARLDYLDELVDAAMDDDR